MRARAAMLAVVACCGLAVMGAGAAQIGLGPDGLLYISVGSSCNACDETRSEHATLLRMSPEGGARAVLFARGLRNTIGFGWHQPPEELSHLVQGDFGWPLCFGDRRPDPFVPGVLIEDGKAHFGRPAGLAVARDGALLVSDDSNGVVYRVTHRRTT